MKTREVAASLRREMEKVLDEKRFDHTLGVAYTCTALAFVHGADVDQALCAGMLHDCAKCIPDGEKIRLCEAHDLGISEPEKKAPSLLHAKLGAFLAAHQYGVTDPAVLDAIRCHTTGRPAMTLLDKILFVADYIEPGRKKLPHMEQIRREAFLDLDLCVLHILQDTMAYLKEKAKVLDPMTQETLAYYTARKGAQ